MVFVLQLSRKLPEKNNQDISDSLVNFDTIFEYLSKTTKFLVLIFLIYTFSVMLSTATLSRVKFERVRQEVSD